MYLFIDLLKVTFCCPNISSCVYATQNKIKGYVEGYFTNMFDYLFVLHMAFGHSAIAGDNFLAPVNTFIKFS